jgi:hypothetical protein
LSAAEQPASGQEQPIEELHDNLAAINEIAINWNH